MADNKKTLYIEDDVLNDLEQDTFGHKHIANAIVQSIVNTKPPYVIGIFGGWGTGKSSLLTMIKSDLSKAKIATVTIDAWRYSSTGNLRRAFLVHVANELSKGLLGELRRRLYATEQEIAPKQKSEFEKNKGINWGNLLNMSLTFIGISLIFLGFLFTAFSIRTFIQIDDIGEFFTQFDWIAFIDKFVDLAFVPFLLTLVNYLSFYIVQRPVTITHERIDADELFSYYFQKIVEQVTKKKKQLVIFIDNLDRLSDDKMVEALESIKAYINNDNCVFVVACDDNVVRSIVNESPVIPKIANWDGSGRKAGEHYLDKFFQQTFRLPEYMAINLHDFAIKNLEATFVYDELLPQVDIGNLVSIVLPSDVGSPRKVKRLLNEFISLFEIVKRREGEQDGQLKKGTLTADLEFLGKFSTLRAEYPSFYKALINDSALLTRATGLIQQNNDEVVRELMAKLNIENVSSLLSYLRKTQTIMANDIDPYIWLSQDILALGLKGNHYNLLRTSLADRNIDQVKDLLASTEDIEYKILLARVSSRLVTQRLVGIDRQNGVRVLSSLLSSFDGSIKSEVANVIANVIPEWPTDVFSADEILNVLRWAYGVSIRTQKEKLVNQILDRLNDAELRKVTFEAVLQNADIIADNNGTYRVQAWLAGILKRENQSVHLMGEGDNAVDINLSNRDFAEWLLNGVNTYSKDKQVVDSYFSQTLVEYSTYRLLGDETLQGVYLADDGLGKNIDNLFQVLARRVSENIEVPDFWSGILNIIEGTNYVEDLEFCIDHLKTLIKLIPINIFEKIIAGTFSAIVKVSKKAGEDKIPDQVLGEIFRQLLLVTESLRERKDKEFDASLLEALPDSINELLLIPVLQDDLLDFVDRFTQKFGIWKADLFVSGVLLALSKPASDLELEKKAVSRVFDLDNFVSTENRGKILSRIDFLVSSNEQDKIDSALSLLDRMVKIEAYRQQLESLSVAWLEKLSPDAVSILQSRTKMFHLLMSNKLLSPDAYVERIVKLLPFGGNKDQLLVIFEEVDRMKQIISQEKGKMLFSAVLANVSILGSEFPKALDISSLWVDNAEESERLSFDLNIVALYKNAPNIHLPIQLVSWTGMTIDQIEDHLVQIYLKEIDENLKANRDVAVKNAINVIDISERKEAVLFIWNKLINDRDAAEDFMYVVKASLTREEIRGMRQNSVDIIRENTDPALSINNLRLLASTIRNDLDDVDVIVNLFVNLFGRGADDVQMALNHVAQCLGSFDLGREHKYNLSEAMSHAVTRSDEEIRVIVDKAREIDLRWFRYKRNKDKDNE